MKGVESTINKRLRKIFKNAGFDTYLINEFRTSKLCNCCHNEPFLIRESKKPRDKKLNKKILINGLLCHQDIKPQCKIIHNRDKNAVQNMLYIIDTLKLTGKRFLENFVF
jgi:transposase